MPESGQKGIGEREEEKIKKRRAKSYQKGLKTVDNSVQIREKRGTERRVIHSHFPVYQRKKVIKENFLYHLNIRLSVLLSIQDSLCKSVHFVEYLLYFIGCEALFAETAFALIGGKEDAGTLEDVLTFVLVFSGGDHVEFGEIVLAQALYFGEIDVFPDLTDELAIVAHAAEFGFEAPVTPRGLVGHDDEFGTDDVLDELLREIEVLGEETDVGGVLDGQESGVLGFTETEEVDAGEPFVVGLGHHVPDAVIVAQLSFGGLTRSEYFANGRIIVAVGIRLSVVVGIDADDKEVSLLYVFGYGIISFEEFIRRLTQGVFCLFVFVPQGFQSLMVIFVSRNHR